MGMTIDKAILRVEHSQMNVDDKETADFIIDTMRKYQKIQDIYDTWNDDLGIQTHRAMNDIGQVLNRHND